MIYTGIILIISHQGCGKEAGSVLELTVRQSQQKQAQYRGTANTLRLTPKKLSARSVEQVVSYTDSRPTLPFATSFSSYLQLRFWLNDPEVPSGSNCLGADTCG